MGPAWKNNELWTGYLSGIESACRERSARLTMYMADNLGEEIVDEILRSADGVLLKTPEIMPVCVRKLISRLPAVGFGAVQTLDPLPQVVLDNHAAGVIAVNQLRRLGHRRIAFLNHAADEAIFVARANGYLEAMKAAGEFRPEYLLEFIAKAKLAHPDPEPTPPDLSSQLDALLNCPERPTAAVLANDWAACGLIQACAARGIRVPEDLSIVGMDDSGNLCSLMQPSLSSVAMPFQQASRFAACMLCDLIGGIGIHQRNVASALCLPGEFRRRDSVAAITALPEEGNAAEAAR